MFLFYTTLIKYKNMFIVQPHKLAYEVPNSQVKFDIILLSVSRESIGCT